MCPNCAKQICCAACKPLASAVMMHQVSGSVSGCTPHAVFDIARLHITFNVNVTLHTSPLRRRPVPASKVSVTWPVLCSYAIKKKDEIERVAKANR